MAYNISRLTLYALISAIEEDLREAILQSFDPSLSPKEFLGDDLFCRSLERLDRDIGTRSDGIDLVDLLPYIDFGDSFELLNSNRSHLPEGKIKPLKRLTGKLAPLIPIRNRVAHTRPLNFDDLATMLDTAKELISERVLNWNNLDIVMRKLTEEPSFVLGMTIPVYDTDDDAASHNLPTPDFDETGFLGRESQIKQLVNLCKGPYPVISIVGEGGIGKTALALKTAYELLDSEDVRFDSIVWTSSKTAQLSAQEVIRIENAISDSLGMFQSVARHLAGDLCIAQPLDEILEYLKEFRILLILDNLETVLDERVRGFLSRLPTGSKVMLTSRIGVGAFEYPVKLEPMTEKEAIHLMRSLSRVRGLDKLFAVSNGKLAKYCARMNYNPGYIKWFVSAVQAGKRPEEILNESHVFLDFCMSNVYEYLSSDAKTLLRSMLCVPGRHSQAELSYLTEMDALELQKSIHELLRTNFVSMNSVAIGSSFETHYETSEMARRYLSKQHPTTAAEHEHLNRRKRQMTAAKEQFEANRESDPYSFYSLAVRSKSDTITAKYLIDSLKAARRNEFESAVSLVNEAKKLAPEYYEVYRVEAILQTQMGNLAAAQNLFESAIDLESASAPLRKWYGDFLLKYLDDANAALEQYEHALKRDPGAVEIQIMQALANMYLQRFDLTLDILGPIVARSADIDLRVYRKVYDVYLECMYREADSLVERRQVAQALTKISELKFKFENCPPDVVDVRMREKLKKVADLAMICVRIDAGTEHESRAKTLADDLYQTARLTRDRAEDLGEVYRGEICSINRNRGYAFISVAGRNNVFAHATAFPNQEAWANLSVGHNVKFYIGKDEQGRDQAVRVAPV